MKDQHLPNRTLLSLLVLALAVIAPHVFYQPIWLSVALFGLIIWRFGIVMRWLPSGAAWIKYGLLLGVLGGFIASYSGGASTEGMVALLSAGLVLKLIETKDRRSAWILLGVSVMVSAATFLHTQSILAAAYVVATFVLVLLVMVRLSAEHQIMMVSTKKAASLLMQALPLTVLLFLIMPRIPPLWAVPTSASAVTGVAERFSPGQISNLTRTGDVAFRVKFDGDLPSQNKLYWRMMTYSDFVAGEWIADEPEGPMSGLQAPSQKSAQQYRYEVVANPTGVRALPVLALPSSLPVSATSALQANLRSNYTLRRDRPFSEKTLYRAVSIAPDAWPAESGQSIKRALVVSNDNPQLLEFAKLLRKEVSSPTEYIAALLDIYRQHFSYSLTPSPTNQEGGVDQFFFETQEGFCGHFAGATALMLRAVGIPARVVAGYQGGEFTEDGYFVVRAYDAHAWVEAWVKGQGWVRVDPTQAVEANRLVLSVAELYGGEGDFLADDLFARAGLDYAWYGKARMLMDAANFEWQRWVLRYDDKQGEFLKGVLGELSPLRMALALVIPGGIILGLVVFFVLYRARPSKSVIERYLEKVVYLNQGLRQGRETGESVTQYMRRLSTLFPQHNAYFYTLNALYSAYRYQPRNQNSDALERRLLSHLKSKPVLKIR